MTAPLTPAEHDKLIRVLEITRSAGDGETLAAVHAARRILSGRSYREIWSLPLAAPSRTSSPPPYSPAPFDWRATATWCLRRPDLLGWRELEFLRSIAQRWSGALTPKQRAWLEQLAERVELATGCNR